jgi:hypothetical protein
MRAYFDWLAIQYPAVHKVTFHVANEGKRSWAHGKDMKKAGLKAGVSDIIMLYPSGGYHGACIEVKTKSKKPDSNQMEFLHNTEVNGFYSDWFDNIDDLMAHTKQYLEL